MENNPSGMITLYGEKQMEAFAIAVETVAQMYNEGCENGKLSKDASMTVKPITRTCFRVEVSGFVETKDED